MFNIPDANSGNYQTTLLNMQASKGRRWFLPWLNSLILTYKDIAYLIEHGNSYDSAISKQQQDITLLYNRMYPDIANYFAEFTFTQFRKVYGKSVYPLQRKDMENIFQEELNLWTRITVAEKVVNIANTTKQLIKREILRGLKEGLSNKEIADIIRSKNRIFNTYRAKMIVRTETHSVCNKAIDSAVKSTRYPHDRIWTATKDDRVRGANPKDRFNHLIANGQRRDIGKMFDISGEKLEFPGDPKGSAGNVIQCRCVLRYETKVSNNN